MSDPRGEGPRAFLVDVWGIIRLAITMLRKLRENRHKEHWLTWKPGWRDDGYFLERIDIELAELFCALEKKDWKEMMRESADIANFAMMVHERARRRQEGM